MNSDVLTIYFSDKLYADYFKSFCPQNKKKHHIVSRNNDIGRRLISILRYSDSPQKNKIPRDIDKLHPAQIIINTKEAFSHSIGSKFIYLTREDMIRFNDYVISDFNAQLKMFCINAQYLSIQYNKAIEIFMDHFKIDPDSFEAIKKKDYRFRKKIKEILFEKL